MSNVECRKTTSDLFVIRHSSFVIRHFPRRRLVALAQDPFGGGQPVQAPAAKPVEPPAEIKITNPRVQAMRRYQAEHAQPMGPGDDTLIDLKHAPVAKQYRESTAGARTSAKINWRSLHREFGSPVFLKIGGHPELAPEGKQLSDAVFEAARKQAEDPARLAEAIASYRIRPLRCATVPCPNFAVASRCGSRWR